MSKSDKDIESRTVANPPLQQSSFVFFPEEKMIRKKILEHPELSIRAASAALEDQKKKLERQTAFLLSAYALGAQTGTELSALAASFTQKLPKSVFGVGEGGNFLLPLDLLFERVKACEMRLDRLILELDPFWQPDRFDPARFAFLETILPQANLQKEAEAVGAKGETIRTGARTLSERIGIFCQTAVEPFFQKAAEAADLEENGANMRFGKLGALCGELQNAAAQFARECTAKAGEFRKF